MTKEESRKRAEEFVFCYCNLGDILRRCEYAGIKTHNSKEKQISRTTLEEQLIDHYTELYTTEKGEQNNDNI